MLSCIQCIEMEVDWWTIWGTEDLWYLDMGHISVTFLLYLFLAALGLPCCLWAFPSVASGSYSLVVCGLCVAVASLVVEHRFWDTRAQ